MLADLEQLRIFFPVQTADTFFNAVKLDEIGSIYVRRLSVINNFAILQGHNTFATTPGDFKLMQGHYHGDSFLLVDICE